MRKNRLEIAMNEARRFLLKAESLHELKVHSGNYYYASKESGSVNRASMDLTRALADLRRSGD